MLKEFDLGYYGLTGIIRPFAHSTPLAQMLLKHIPFWTGKCTAILPQDFSKKSLYEYYKFAYTSWYEHSDINSEASGRFVVEIIRDYFEKNGSGSYCLIEDVDWTQADYDDWKERSVDYWEDTMFFNDKAYLYLSYPLPDDEKMLDYVTEATSFSFNPSVLFNWPEFDVFVKKERELDITAIEEIAKHCDVIYVTSFDFMSFLLWRRGV